MKYYNFASTIFAPPLGGVLQWFQGACISMITWYVSSLEVLLTIFNAKVCVRACVRACTGATG